MNKLITLSLSIALIAGLVSCSKVNPNKTGTNPVFTTPIEPLNPSDPLYTVGRVPFSFTQKVVIEEITGEWCGACGGTGAPLLNQLIKNNPDRVYGVAIHGANNEPFEITPAYDGFKTAVFAPGGLSFPAASINRRASISAPDYDNTCGLDLADNWANQLSPASKKTATCGLALVADEENDNVKLDVFVGYNSPLNMATSVTVYLIEDDVPPLTSKKVLLQEWLTNNNIAFDEHFLKMHIIDLIKSNRSERIFKLDHILKHDRLHKDRNISILRTPQYHPELQPIEICWGVMKQYMAQHCDFTLDGLRKNLETAWTKVTDETI